MVPTWMFNQKFIIMVTIVDFAERQNKDGEQFFVLILEGGLEIVKSQESGKFYATSRRCSITSTFNEVGCKQLIGKSIPGKIEKAMVEEYDYQIPGTEETVKLDYEWVFNPEPATMEEHVYADEINS